MLERQDFKKRPFRGCFRAKLFCFEIRHNEQDQCSKKEKSITFHEGFKNLEKDHGFFQMIEYIPSIF